MPQLKKNIRDLIILDLKMPNSDGMTLYRKIEKIDETVRVCLTTVDKNYIQELRKEITDIEKIVLYKPVLLKT
ncbi:MAG: response regulator [Nitrososphaeraceae archaeon]